jgi:hypothetical protein
MAIIERTSGIRIVWDPPLLRFYASIGLRCRRGDAQAASSTPQRALQPTFTREKSLTDH